MEDDQQFCLRWNNHQSTLISVFDTLLENGTLVDCTLAAEGRFLKAHKVVLSACSPYFATLLSQQYDKHPIFILKDVKYQELKAMMDYMYRGEVNISQDQLAALLKAAESLQIKGLSDNRRGGGGGGNSGSGNSANQAGEDNTQRHVPVAQTTTQQQPPQQQQQPGYTIEQRRPLKHTTNDTEVIDSREGSASPTSKRRKRIRRRSIYENNVVLDNHELSNSSSQSMAHPVTSTPLATATSSQLNSATSGGATTSVAGVSSGASSAAVAAAVTTAVAVGATTSGGSPYVMNVTKKTDTNIIHDTNSEIDNAQDSDRDDDASNTTNTTMSQHHHQQPTHHPQQSQTHIRLKKQEMDLTNSKDKMDPHSELLIEPKSEYDDGNDEPVEDLTLDDEELLEDLDQAGPSHGGEGSSQGYAQWQVERSQDEVYMSSQDGSGQHRDAQAADQIDDCLLESDDIVVSPKNGNNIYVLTTKQAKLRTKNKAEHFLKSISTECELVRIPPGLTIKKKIEKEPSIVSITKDKSVIKPVSNTVQQLMPTMPLPLPLPSLPPLPPLPAPAPAPLVPGPPSLPPSAPTPTSASTTTPTPAPLLPQTIPIIISVPSGLSNSLGQTFYNNNNQHFQILNVTALPPTTATISPITTTITPKDSLIGSNISENKNVLLDKSCDTEDIEDDQQQDNDMATNDNDNDNVIDIDDEEEEEDEEEDETENENSNDNNITDDNSRCGNNSAIGTDDDGTVYTTINVLQYGDNYVLDTGNDSYKSAELLQHDNSRLIKTEYIINDYTPQGGTSDATTNERELYACKLCGRRYRWKSTLRRHENVECGGKSPSYECPYCDYKAKQRGNLGVHVRKHHPALPQLKSKRKK